MFDMQIKFDFNCLTVTLNDANFKIVKYIRTMR